ncbi:uncharacterized protein LOC117171439 [Belonocnema kinseyi]|uniref:uncharacterized protein LOC117171439 n=1 Tax=Belonocnema kinseyi TaxID=2817044 RepID=UPI00143DE3F1|nr:uncharacterized protein LOC117171439 [Belonocnema kinseyi]
MRKESKCKKTLIYDFRFEITLSIIVSLFSFYEAAPVYIRELQCLAIQLKPADCEKIVAHFPPGSAGGKHFFNTTQCFESLVYWTLNSKLKQKDAYILLKNRLYQIGRADLISLIQNCANRFPRELLDETIDDWGDNEEKSHPKVKHTKSEKDEEGKNKQQHKNNFHNHFLGKVGLGSYNKTLSEYPCLSHPYLVLGIVSFITFITCCCTLCIRRKIVACLNICRPKKKNKKSSGKYVSIDAERGQTKKKKSFSLKSGTKKSNDPSKALINTATQDSQASVLNVDDELTPTGCSQCCKKKKKRKKRKK